jgi:glycosyltransferase involved in cell wall biosynthesis
MMRVSVAICTWNRAGLLDQTLTQMNGLVVPADVDWELLVVNNNCTDDTDEVLAHHHDRLPLRRLCEPASGLSHARNAAIRAVRGDLILWTDDDVLVDPNWLAEYVAAARAWPEVSFFGGTIAPWFATPAPAWMTAAWWPCVSSAYGARECGEHPFEIEERILPFGANWAIRTGVQRRYRFDPNLGRKGKQRLCGEETTLIKQLLAEGHRGRFIPAARIRHFIPSECMNLEYVRGWYFGLGQTMAAQEAHPAMVRTAKIYPFARVWFWLNAVCADAGYRLTRRFAKPQRWVRYATHSSFCRGVLSPPSPEYDGESTISCHRC